MKKPLIQIEVVSDVVCPWCYIGKRRMERAIDRLKDDFDFEITFSPFELNPGMPPEGIDQRSYLANKFGGNERYESIIKHVTEIARGEGIEFHYERQHISPNTRVAHRIIWLAKQEGKQLAVKEALLKAYFEEGKNLSQNEILIDIAVKAGLSQEAVESLINSDAGEAEVIMSEQISQQRGVTGVPFYIINNQYGLSGAQPSETFEKVFQGVVQKMEPVPKDTSTEG